MPPLLLCTLPRAARHKLSCFALYASGTASNLTSKGRGSSGLVLARSYSKQAVAAGFLSHHSSGGCCRGTRRESKAETPFPPLFPDGQILLHPPGLSCICLHLPKMTQSHTPSTGNAKPSVYISNIKLFIILLLAEVDRQSTLHYTSAYLFCPPVESLVCDKASINIF